MAEQRYKAGSGLDRALRRAGLVEPAAPGSSGVSPWMLRWQTAASLATRDGAVYDV